MQGRQILEVALIANEVGDESSGPGKMVITIDFEKSLQSCVFGCLRFCVGQKG